MNSLLQNVKSGFANIKELFGIFLSDENNQKDDYDLYIKSEDLDISQTAQELKTLEEQQESDRLSIFIDKNTKKERTSKKSVNRRKRKTHNVRL